MKIRAGVGILNGNRDGRGRAGFKRRHGRSTLPDLGITPDYGGELKYFYGLTSRVKGGVGTSVPGNKDGDEKGRRSVMPACLPLILLLSSSFTTKSETDAADD
jgi:hypothetical protein